MKLTEDARRKLVGLLGRLGSNNDNEILAAVRLIEAGRKAADFQWDEVIVQPLTVAAFKSGFDFNTAARPPRQPARASENAADIFDSLDEFENLLDDAEAGATTQKEMDFVADMRAKADTYGLRAFLSEAQLAWLRALAERAS